MPEGMGRKRGDYSIRPHCLNSALSRRAGVLTLLAWFVALVDAFSTPGLCKTIVFCKPIQQFATQFREPWFGRKAKTPCRWDIRDPDAAGWEMRRPRSPEPEHSGKTDSHELANWAWPRSLAPEKHVDSRRGLCSVSIPMVGSWSLGRQVYQATTQRF